MTVPVLIVGAGPTGLVMALWLAKAKVPLLQTVRFGAYTERT